MIADSKELAEKISSRYGVDRDRIIPMPHCPSPFIKELPAKDTTEILKIFISSNMDIFFIQLNFGHTKTILESLKQ